MRREFGQVRRLRSGRWQARWKLSGVWYTARRDSDAGPLTFTTQKQAEDHLTWVRREIEAGRWQPPTSNAPRPVTFRTYADAWLPHRGLADTTRDHYEQLLRDHIYPTFGDVAVTGIRPADVRTWHAGLGKVGPTARAHAYGLLRTILATAVADELISANPCRIRGAGQSKRARQIRPASLAELEVIVGAMPDRLKLLVLLAAWCALRFGELAELRRGDVDQTNGVIHVRRGVTRRKRKMVKDPKTEAGKRTVSIPPHLMPLVKTHLRQHAQVGRNGLVFPADHGAQLASSTLARHFYRARRAAGRPDLRFHDLRHTGAVLAASTGATLAELMARLGHSTVGAALRYQHAAQDRDRVIADALSQLAAGSVTDISQARGHKAATKTTRRRREGKT